MKRNASVGMACLWTFVIIISVLILTSCKTSYQPCDAYGVNSICNPDNGEFIVEVAFNLGIAPEEVTQEQFDNRYSAGY